MSSTINLSRRRMLQSAAVAVAAATASSMGGISGAQALGPMASVATGPTSFIPTSRVDPRSYLKSGQTWTTVACIRPALQAAIDEAHKRTAGDPAAVVEVVIPPGVGRLTTRSPKAPLNRSSQTNPKGQYDLRIGFGLRANIQGKIVFRGSGGQSRASVIRLSDAARNLFWIDSDTGIDWQPTGALEASGAVVERPTKPAMLRNVLFQGFGVDNNLSVGHGHIVCGNVPGFTTPQRYVSIQNVHAVDIDVWGVKQAFTAEHQAATNKAPFVYIGRHFSDYEGNGGPGNGKMVGHAWKKWDLNTVYGRTRAHQAGWTWMNALSFDRVRGTNTNRGIIVVGEPTESFSHYVNDITLQNCAHLQDRPYTEGTVQQTSFFIGGSCQGGTTSILSCTSVNIGDDAIEIGGMQSSYISRLTCVNACLAGIYLRSAQPPLDWRTMKVVVEDSTFSVTGDAITPTQSAGMRAVPIEAFFDGDATSYALNELRVTRCTTSIDGVNAAGAQVGVLDKMTRTQRYGWMVAGPIANAVFTECAASLTRVRLGATRVDRYYRMVMWHGAQELPPALGVTPKTVMTDCSADVTGMVTNGGRGEFVGHAVHSTGSVTTIGFTVSIQDCGNIFRIADMGRIGWIIPGGQPRAGISSKITNANGSVSGSTVDYAKAIAIYDDQPVGQSTVTNIGFASWGAGAPVHTGHGPSNAETLTTG